MAGEHGGGSHEHSAQNIIGEVKPVKLLFDVLDKTIDGVFATPVAQAGLDVTTKTGEDLLPHMVGLGSTINGGGGGHKK